MSYYKKTIFNKISGLLHVTTVVATGVLGFAGIDAMYGQIDAPTSELSENARIAAERDFQNIIDLNEEINTTSHVIELEYSENGNTREYRSALNSLNDQAERLEKDKERFVYRAYTNTHFSEADFLDMREKVRSAGFEMPMDMTRGHAQHLEACRIEVADGPTPLAPDFWKARSVKRCAEDKAFNGFMLSSLGGMGLAWLMGFGLSGGRGRQVFETIPNDIYRRVTKPKPKSNN